MSVDRAEDREWLADLLPKAAHKHIPAILAAFAPERVEWVEVTGARVVVEMKYAYGLALGIDANGNAATVGFPYGADVTDVVA